LRGSRAAAWARDSSASGWWAPAEPPPGLEAGFIQAFGKAFLMPLDLVVGLLAYWDRRQRLFNHLSDTQVVEETG